MPEPKGLLDVLCAGFANQELLLEVNGMVHDRGDSCSVGAPPRSYNCHPIYPTS